MNTVDFRLVSRFEGQESLKKQLTGKYTWKEPEARIMYAQTLVEGEKPVPEVVSVRLDEKGRPQRAEIHRPGSDFRLTFEKGENAVTWLSTPAGDLKVEIAVRTLQGLFTEHHFELTIRYEMLLGGESHGMTQVEYLGNIRR